jgi:uncharacterized protein (DUF58 family)
MKAISHFLRITVLGGVLFLTPIVVLAFILCKAFDLARRGLKPMATIIPDRFVSGVTMEAILAIVLIAILCFLAGLFARTQPAQRIMAELESSVLSKVPAYEYLKQAGASVMGLGETADHPVVFAQLGGARRSRPAWWAAAWSRYSSPIPRTRCPDRSFSSPPTASAQPRFHSLRLLVASGVAALGRKRF